MVFFLDVYFEEGYSKHAREGDLLYIGRCDDRKWVEESDYIYFNEGEEKICTNMYIEKKKKYKNVRFISEHLFRNFPMKSYDRYGPTFEVEGIRLSYSPVGTYWDFNHCTMENPVHEERVVGKSDFGKYSVISTRSYGVIKPGTGSGEEKFKSMVASLRHKGETEISNINCHTKVYINNAFIIFNSGPKANPFKNRWRKLPHNYNKGKTIDFNVKFIDHSIVKKTPYTRPVPSAPPQ